MNALKCAVFTNRNAFLFCPVFTRFFLILPDWGGVKKIRLDVVRESCSVWTNRLYRMTQNDGNYLRE